MTTPPRHVIFDFGGVLVDWDPRHLYRDLIGDEDVMETFLADVCSQDWNRQQDGGRGTAEATAVLVREFPEHRDWIEAYYDQFDRMMKAPIEGTVTILRDLKKIGVPVFGLTNASADTFPMAERRFAFLQLFDGIVVSGREGMMKPDPAIFHLAMERFALPTDETVFIDDSLANVESAAALGFHTHHFRDPDGLRRDLVGWGLLEGQSG